MFADELTIVLTGLLLVVLPVAVLIMAIAAFVRSGRVVQLDRRIERLEALVQQLSSSGRPETSGERAAGPAADTLPREPAPSAAEPVPARLAAEPAEPHEPIHWEMLIGKRALGWVAVVLLAFAAAFFIRYAIDNDWIGPLGQVALAELGGLILIAAGYRFARRGWRLFSQMLSAAGTVVLYLATYAAFGFYQLISRDAASAFLVLILIESALLALAYNAPAIGLTAVIGGLLTPVLMHSAHDDYAALFTYLAVLNVTVVLLLLASCWAAIGSVALVGTQVLFWLWYLGNYHPEKFAWALGFQAVVYGLYLAHNLAVHAMPRRRAGTDQRAGIEDLVRLVLAPAFAFAALYVVLRDDALLWQRAEPWMGTAAMVMAVLYAVVARGMLAVETLANDSGAAKPRDPAHVFTALSVSVGFLALAFPLQADAAWVALGWAAEGAVLWWFGQRISSGRLCSIAGALLIAAVVRLLVYDLPPGVREPFVPVLNRFALPAIGVAFCLLGGAISTRRILLRREPIDRTLAGLGAGAGVVLLWLILSIDSYDYFEVRAFQRQASRAQWLWLGQMALSVLWAVYATVLLVIGFRANRSWLRWMALALYGATVLKVFLVDIQELDEIYRIVAFFVLAIFIGLAAWGYQRVAPPSRRDETVGGEHG